MSGGRPPVVVRRQDALSRRKLGWHCWVDIPARTKTSRDLEHGSDSGSTAMVHQDVSYEHNRNFILAQ
ncbi:unnamed protein product [Jaminaea pallidilutea]